MGLVYFGFHFYLFSHCQSPVKYLKGFIPSCLFYIYLAKINAAGDGACDKMIFFPHSQCLAIQAFCFSKITLSKIKICQFGNGVRNANRTVVFFCKPKSLLKKLLCLIDLILLHA